MPRLTILICTHNRVELLGKTLASLNAAGRPGGWAVDILVVANACQDATHTFLDGYREQASAKNWLPMQWYAEPRPGKSNALNSALPRVESDLVAFVDDDHRVDGGYLQAVCQTAEKHPDADLFCGRILPDWDGREPAWVHDTGPYRIYPLPVPRFDQGDIGFALSPERAIPGGGNLFLRTTWLARVGAFNTAMGPTGHDLGGAEDLDWVLRALRLGARLWYAPEVTQYHYVDLSRLRLGYLLRKAYKRSASTIGLDGAGPGTKVPLYLYRKLATYGFNAMTAWNPARRRFYLVRSAAALGEIAGHLARGRSATGASST